MQCRKIFTTGLQQVSFYVKICFYVKINTYCTQFNLPFIVTKLSLLADCDQ